MVNSLELSRKACVGRNQTESGEPKRQKNSGKQKKSLREIFQIINAILIQKITSSPEKITSFPNVCSYEPYNIPSPKSIVLQLERY
jgi:hypothetical protein